MATEPQRVGVFRGRWWVRGLACAVVGLVSTDGPTAIAQQISRLLPPDLPTDLSKRPIATIYGNITITREELGDYLIARGGIEKLDLLVNKDIIEYEAGRRRFTVTSIEIRAALNEELLKEGLTLEQFTQNLLPRYGKSMYEWEQDVLRPRLLLGKIARDRVKVTDDDLKRAYENLYGEQREAQVIIWPTGQGALTESQKASALVNPEEFADLAKRQPNGLAQSAGKAKPIGRHSGMDKSIEDALFSLKIGEAKWVETSTTSTCVKCVTISTPVGAPTFEQIRAKLEQDVRDKKLTIAIGEVLRELKAAANATYTTQVPVPSSANPQAPPPVRIQHPDPRVLAIIYKDVPVTRADLGEFLIARGGFQKVELLVNRRIIEREAIKRGVTVTPEEVEAKLVETLKGVGLCREGPGLTPADAIRQGKHDFATQILPRSGMTMYEYTEDVLKPELAMAKMCRDQIKVTDEDLRKAFINRYGEKRQPKLILWSKDDFRTAAKDWEEARKSDADFDRVAKRQRDPRLAAQAGLTVPVGQYLDADNPLVEQLLFGYPKDNGALVGGLQLGEVSHLVETPAGIMCVKCHAIIQPDTGVTLESKKTVLEKEIYDRKLAKEIPVLFAKMREVAQPNILLKGPPTPEENAAGVQQLLQQIGTSSPAPAK